MNPGMNITHPSGLFYFEDAVPAMFGCAMEKWLHSPTVTNNLFPVSNAQGKSSDNARRVLHYGYKYNYSTSGIREQIEPFPHIVEVLRSVIPLMWTDAPDSILKTLNQCLINRYLPGQGIGAHIDSLEYGGIVVCFTFGAGREMEFTRTGYAPYTVYTLPMSMYVMTGESRNKWKHQMRPRKTDGKNRRRSECFSVTFREVNPL